MFVGDAYAPAKKGKHKESTICKSDKAIFIVVVIFDKLDVFVVVVVVQCEQCRCHRSERGRGRLRWRATAAVGDGGDSKMAMATATWPMLISTLMPTTVHQQQQ